MQKYELLLILPGTLEEQEAEQKLVSLTTLITEHGTAPEVMKLGKNRLAYPVKHIRYGYVYTLVFEAESANVASLQQKLSLMRDLLRATVSHYRVSLSDVQKVAYAEDKNVVGTDKQPQVEPKKTAPVGQTPVRKTESAAELQEIEKKLDKIIDQTDIIPGV